IGGAPDREGDRAQVMAMILQMAKDEAFRGLLAEFPGGGRGDGAGIDGIEIAAGGEHIEPPARGGAGGAGGDELAIEAGEEGRHFGGAGGGQARTDGGGDGGEDGGSGGPVGFGR